MTVKRKGPWKNHRHSDEATMKAPRYCPGDPVTTATGESARVMFARADGIVFLELSDGSKATSHEDTIAWAPGFQPQRRR